MKERTPQEVRELTERDYQRWMGLDAAAAHRQAMDDFATVEAARRTGDIGGGPSPAPLPATFDPESHRTAEIRRAENENRVRIVDAPQDADFERFGLLHADPTTIDEGWALCMGRIRRIVEGADSIAKTYREAVRGCTCPDLAYRVVETLAFFKLRHRIGSRRAVVGASFSGSSDHNPFRGLSDVDACRVLRRIFEDIADASSGRLGPWRIPK